MKKVLFTWAVCMLISSAVLFGGCAFIKVRGKTFTLESAKIDYAGQDTPNLAQIENERLNVVNAYKNFNLSFLNSNMVTLINGTSVYYYQDGNEVRLYTNEARTEKYFEGDKNFKIRVQQDKVVISYYGDVNNTTKNYVYILVFTEQEV